MDHDISLISTLTWALLLAFIFGFLAARLRLPPLVGYLLAGVAIGPFTPGVVADSAIASQLAEIGVILLMFGVGLHFSLTDLMAVRNVALPGAIAQIVVATTIGATVAHAWGWGVGASLVFGLALSVASTVVLLRALEQRNTLDSSEGHIAVGWLIVEDLFTVLALVLLPVLAQPSQSATAPGAPSAHPGVFLTLSVALAKLAAFVAFTLLVGKRVVPWILMQVARTGSRELFTLSVLTIALGLAYGSATLFDVSFALGAFFAGVILNESDLSHQAGADSLPLQDAFSVLFFVSVGMLFDPSILMREPLQVVTVLAIIIIGKSVAAFVIVLAFRYPLRTALTISASLAQIGEFSFILAGLGVTLGLLPVEGRDLILAGSLLSITLNPLTFAAIRPILACVHAHPRLDALLEPSHHPTLTLTDEDRGRVSLQDHAIVVGYGRVGSAIGTVLKREGLPFVVVESDRRKLDRLRARGISGVYGDATARGVLPAAHLSTARLLVIAVPDGFQGRRILEIARKSNPGVHIIARTHSDVELARLESLGVNQVVMGERELAVGMLAHTLTAFGVEAGRARTIIEDARSTAVHYEPQQRAP